MAAGKGKEPLLSLAEILALLPAETLRRLDFENMALGAFVKNYVGTPHAEDLLARSSIREDAVIRELKRLLGEVTDTHVHILDACCGLGGLARRITKSLGRDAGRVAFWAIDRDTACIETLRAQGEEFAALHSFFPIQREICDLGGAVPNPLDLIVLNNVLHEIPPRQFPRMFSGFHPILNPDRGRLCIIDMEQLPVDEPEAIAIAWRGDEVERILRAGGLIPEVTTHEKRTNVYQAHARFGGNGIQEEAMKVEIRALLSDKLHEVLRDRRRLEAGSSWPGPEMLREWIVLTGTIARISDELYATSAWR